MVGRVSRKTSMKSISKELKRLEVGHDPCHRARTGLEAVMNDSCVIPFKFATLFKSEDNLKTMLAKRAAA